jgi:hypothetical protein
LAVIAGLILPMIGLLLSVPMVGLPLGIPIGLAGVLICLWGCSEQRSKSPWLFRTCEWSMMTVRQGKSPHVHLE